MKTRHSFRRILPAAVLAPLVLTCTLTPPASAETLYWANQTTGNFLWTDVNQWRTATVPAPHAAPVDGDTISMSTQTYPFSLFNCGIDVAGATLNLPNSTFAHSTNYGKQWTFYDSATLTANNNPLLTQTDFTPVAPSTTLVEAANASTQVLTLSQVTGNKAGSYYFYIPISVSGNMKFQEAGVEHYYGNVSAGGVLATGNNGWTTDVYFHGGITISGTFIQPYRSSILGDGQQLYLEGPININTMEHQGGEIYIASTASGTYTNYNLKNGWLFNASNAITFSNLNWTGGSYFANGASALASLGSSVTVPANGALSIGVAQSSLPAMTTVTGYGALTGDMTGAVYSGGGQNVTLNENAVFLATAGPEPTRADLGGAKLYMAIANGSTGGPYVVGDDGSTSLYKGFAFGNNWTTSNTFNKQLTAVGGDLKGYINYVGLIVNTGNIWMGDGTSHTANVKFSPTGFLNLTQSFNAGQSDPNLITTFNLSRDAGAETANLLVISNAAGRILDGQTVNVDKGSIGNTQNLRNGGLLGTLTLSNGVFAQPTNPFTALDTGNLHFGDRAVVALGATANLGYLEELGDEDVTCSDRPIALLPDNTPINLNLGANQVLAKVLRSSDVVWSEYRVVTFSSDLPLGHARFAYNCWNRTDVGRFLRPSVGTEKITYAANAPAGETAWIGFAATAQPLTIEMEVDAPAAIVQCGTDDPTRLVRPGAFTGVTANNNLIFTKPVTAAGVRLLSGTAQFNQDLSSPSVQIGAGTQLRMAAGKTATVTGALSGTGNWTGGNGVTLDTGAKVAPGNSIGTLNNGGGALTMADGATYECEIGGAGGGTPVAGTDNDLIKGSTATFAGGWNLHLVNTGLKPGDLDGTEVFKLVDATSIVDFADPTLTGAGFDFSNVSFSVSDGDVMMTGLLFSGGVGGDYDDWAANFPDADLSDPDADFDGDGLSNDQERIFGLNPTSGASVNPISVPLAPATGTFSFTRRDPALTKLVYTVWTSTDLQAWTRDTDATLTPGAVVDEVQTVAVQLGAGLLSNPRLFVRVKAEQAPPPPPLLSADFEANDGGFTVAQLGSGTLWAWGDPESETQGGGAVTTGAGGSAKCWGTNLTGAYSAGTDTALRSPVIDLTGVTGASLSFARAIDAPAGHTLEVNVIDDTTDTVIANLMPATEDSDTTTANWGVVGRLNLPAAAYGQPVRLEWRFRGLSGNNDYLGAYLDNVLVTQTP